MITDKMIEVIRAYQDGKTIQVRYAGNKWDAWEEVDEPAWNFEDFEYRAKPEETVDVKHCDPRQTYYQYICHSEDGNFFIHQIITPFKLVVGDYHCGYPVVKRISIGTLS